MVGGKCGDLAGRAVDPDSRAHLEGMALDAALELLIAVMREPHRLAGKEHRRQRDIEHERRVVASAETAADIGELGVDMRRLERARAPCRAGTRSTPPPHRATARRARARASRPSGRTRRGRIPARGTSDRPTGSRTRGRAPAGPDSSRRARRGSARHRPRPWRRAPRFLRERRPHRQRGSSGYVPAMTQPAWIGE